MHLRRLRNPDLRGAATTSLGYDAQYTSADTGLVYMRARVYDPATAQFLSVDPLEALTGEPYSYTADNPLNASDPSGLDFLEEGADAVAGWGDKLTFGLAKTIREHIGDENVNTCSGAYQAGGYAGLATTFFVPGEDEVEGAELGAEGVDEVGNTVTSTTRATPGGDGAESVIIKERGPNSETLQVVHQVGKPLPDGGGTIIIHQHAKYGPLPGSELFFPDVSHSPLDEIRRVEEALHGAVERELDARSVQLRDAGLTVEFDPISRSGEGSGYTSYVEVTLRYADGDVHDVVFFYVAREGRLVVDEASVSEWISKTLDESLAKAMADER